MRVPRPMILDFRTTPKILSPDSDYPLVWPTVADPGTSNVKTAGDRNELRDEHADRLADQSTGRSGHGRDAHRRTRAFESRGRESYGL